MKKPFFKTAAVRVLVLIAVLGGLAAIIIPTIGTVSYPAPKTLDAANLRQIMQASLIYAVDRNDRLPEATDVWDYARLLADAGLLNESTFWQSHLDPANADTAREPFDIVLPSPGNAPRPINPAFRAIKPSIAVALGRLTLDLPATTPVAWTRGLQLDGTWAPHSPYGTDGGYIAFLGGNVVYYQNLSDDGGQLISRKGTKTANILDALPEGVQIGEYVPTPEEQKRWSAKSRDGRPSSNSR